MPTRIVRSSRWRPGRFLFESFDLDRVRRSVELRYRLDRQGFTERLDLPYGWPTEERVPGQRAAALFALHLIGGVSYYKAGCPRHLYVLSGCLDEEQARFWTTVYRNGLAEFFLDNAIDPGQVEFAITATHPISDPAALARCGRPRLLIPFGGGMDSLVTALWCQARGLDCTLLRVGPHPLIDRLAELTGLPLLNVGRTLDPALFRLNQAGALNGHVPITAYISFVAVLTAILYDFDQVVMSNERSADEPTVVRRGRSVNHQWSKSTEFERLMRHHVTRYIAAHVHYFSLLRPWSSLAVTRAFVGHPRYLAHFTSCNAGWRIAAPRPTVRWCGTCARCAFAYAALTAFLPTSALDDTFGQRLFDVEALLPMYRRLLGLEGRRPSACVGTVAETRASFLLAQRGAWGDTAAMRMFRRDCLPHIEAPDALIDAVLEPAGADVVADLLRPF